MSKLLNIKTGTRKKYGSPYLWLHYVVLLAILYLFGVQLYNAYVRSVIMSVGIDLGKMGLFGMTYDTWFMLVFFFFVLALGDMFVHTLFGRAFNWKD